MAFRHVSEQRSEPAGLGQMFGTKEFFDNVVLLATGGYLVYSGPVAGCVDYFEKVLEAPSPSMANPADIFLDFRDSSSS